MEFYPENERNAEKIIMRSGGDSVWDKMLYLSVLYPPPAGVCGSAGYESDEKHFINRFYS